MKTAEEWKIEYDSTRYAPLSERKLIPRDGSFTRAIQLDAMKEGMRRAAGLVPTMIRDSYTRAEMIKVCCEINTAADKLTKEGM